eukprot:1145806-Pelagomonas_calceolata.AAC.5
MSVPFSDKSLLSHLLTLSWQARGHKAKGKDFCKIKELERLQKEKEAGDFSKPVILLSLFVPVSGEIEISELLHNLKSLSYLAKFTLNLHANAGNARVVLVLLIRILGRHASSVIMLQTKTFHRQITVFKCKMWVRPRCSAAARSRSDAGFRH